MFQKLNPGQLSQSCIYCVPFLHLTIDYTKYWKMNEYPIFTWVPDIEMIKFFPLLF